MRLVLIGVLLLWAGTAHSGYRMGIIHTPKYTRLSAPGVSFESEKNMSRHVPVLSRDVVFPFNITAYGPLGGRTLRTVRTPSDLHGMTIQEGRTMIENSNPAFLEVLPRLCPNVVPQTSLFHLGESLPKEWIYQGEKDPLNNVPGLQLFDPDKLTGQQYRTFTAMNGKNVLSLKQVRISYDYEDENIIDYTGPDPVTKNPVVINEGDGGFYANFHYAIFPHDGDLKKIDPQTLLNVAQGRAADIGRMDLKPSIRVHSLIPGPFMSGDYYMYEMCEWGDTAFQASIQSLDYQNIALWDWDYDTAEELWIVVWEGDEEDWLIQKKRLDPLYVTDDLVAVFQVKREDTLAPLTLVNRRKNFQMTVQTGSIKMAR